ncbi:RDD family protein [Mucilaginibacter sp. NFX135]|uniref:RDD family protein n=1 Tax=Mucilaginibacter sp. NFX135 TaxID=3402687 RepID=UPI003AFA3BD7
MFKKQFSAKSVAIIAFVVPVLGILSDSYNNSYGFFTRALSGLLSPLNLQWLGMRNASAAFNLIFCALLLLGAILFVSSKGKETRLPRFAFAIILFNKAIFTLYALSTILTGSLFAADGRSKLVFLAYLIIRLAWIGLAWQVLDYFNKNKQLEIQTNTDEEQTTSNYVSASSGQRFMNLIADMIMAVLLFSTLIEMLIYSDLHNNILMRFQAVIGEKFTLLILIFIGRLLYYVPFEVAFGATPAKYLTETRVINDNGENSDFSTILKRTLARCIPFESFSFLFGNGGWHDRISATSVVKEKGTGVNGRRYFLVVPIGIALWGLSYWGYSEYGAYSRRREYQAERERIKDDIYHKLDNANTEDFFELKTAGSDYYQDSNVFMKVEKISGNSISFSVIEMNKNGQYSQQDIGKVYSSLKGTFKQVSFTKQELHNAVKSTLAESGSENRGLALNNQLYFINDITK